MEAGGAQAIVQVLKTHMDSNSDVLVSNQQFKFNKNVLILF